MARVWLNCPPVSYVDHKNLSVAAKGKFFSRIGSKFFFKGIRLDSASDQNQLNTFDAQIALRNRFDHLAQSHTNGLIVAEDAPKPVLSIAAQSGLQVMVELRIAPEDLIAARSYRLLRTSLARRVKSLREYPAVMGYLIDFPIDADILRERGYASIKRRLNKVVEITRRSHPARMIGLRHRPETIGLALLDEDFIYAVMPPLSPTELRSYVIRLHNLAEARPVIAEFGEGLPGQDELVACAFGLGAAGVVAPAMRPAASRGSLGIKMLSAGELLPFVTLNGSCPPKPALQPMVSVVICAYNAARTMRACLESLRTIDYPNYEVIVVDDGSTDATADITKDFPEFRLIRQPNKGLSVARNVGMQAALGEIVAYTDSDCVVDPHWLSFMVRAMSEGGFDGCGGPNYAPHEDGRIEACVAASPGAPCHVLTGDEEAEHLAGCNMIYRKEALLQIGGFDARFTAAGDDVDICWRLMDAGFRLGFCPSAFVWHFRRNTVKAYYGQQRGYGKAEALLYTKYPERFNVLGQIKWRGVIPGLARTYPGGGTARVGWVRKTGELQPVHEAQLSVLKVLPLTAEWNIGAAAMLAISLALGTTLVPALVALALGPIWAAYYAVRAPLEKAHESFAARLVIAWLAYSGPISRTIARYRTHRALRRGQMLETSPRQRPSINWLGRRFRLTYWNEAYTVREKILERLAGHFVKTGRPLIADSGWNDFDLAVERNQWTRVEFKTADEEHGGNKIKSNVEARVRLGFGARAGLVSIAVAAAITAAAGWSSIAIVLGAVTAAASLCAVNELIEAGRVAYRAIEESAKELNLTPLGRPTAAALKSAAAQRVPEKAPAGAEAAQPAGR